LENRLELKWYTSS